MQDRVRVNYQNVEQQVHRLRALANSHRRRAEVLSAQLQLLHGAWVDPAGAEYERAATKLIGEMRTAADEATKIADSISGVARAYRTQEQTNAAAARRLDS